MDATGLFLLTSLFVLGVCGVAGYLMLARVGRGATGWVLGFLLGPLGVIIAWVIRDNALRDQAEGYRDHVGSAQRRSSTDVDVKSIVIIGGTIIAVFGFLIYNAG